MFDVVGVQYVEDGKIRRVKDYFFGPRAGLAGRGGSRVAEP